MSQLSSKRNNIEVLVTQMTLFSAEPEVTFNAL